MVKLNLIFVNGDLGSGKTTLINQLIKSNSLGNFFIIENEIANLGIDNLCLHLDPKQIKVMSGECVCCADPKELVELLKNLAKNPVQKYENVVIESSGVTSMNQLLSNLLKDQELAELYDIKACVFLVDALGVERTNSFDLEVSDFVVVTKYDAMQKMSQHQKLDEFIKVEFPDVKFLVKDFEDSADWIKKLLENKIKTFREWSLKVNDSKYHGQNFVQILQSKELNNFDKQKIFQSMKNFEVVRVKGFYLKNAILMHVEMTPEQMKDEIWGGKVDKIGVVVVGKNKLLLNEFCDRFAFAKN